MAQVLIVYATSEGHTAAVVDRLTAPLEAAGHHVRSCVVGDAPTSPFGYDAVLVGGSVHVGHHLPALLRWVKGNAEPLARIPSAFFQVSLASASAEGDDQARDYADTFLGEASWRPELVGLFAGALLYTRYGLIKRTMLRSIAGSSGLDTDTHRDFDYTDYDAVDRFANDVLGLLSGRAHRVPA